MVVIESRPSMETRSARARQPSDPFGNNYIAAKEVEFEDSISGESGGEYGKDDEEEKGEEEGVGVSKRSATKKRKPPSGKKADVLRKRRLREKGARNAVPCVECVKSLIAGQSDGKCYRKVNTAGSRCYGCYFHSCHMFPSYLHGVAIGFIRTKEENASNLKSFRVTLRMMLPYINKNDVVGKEKNVDDVHASLVTRQVSRPCTAIEIAIENVDDPVFDALNFAKAYRTLRKRQEGDRKREKDYTENGSLQFTLSMP